MLICWAGSGIQLAIQFDLQNYSKIKIFSIGDQFVLAPNSSYSDVNCPAQLTPARLSFQAHSASLDCKFNSLFASLYVTFHDHMTSRQAISWFLYHSQKIAPANGGSGYTDIWWNLNIMSCSSTHCFRSVSIVMNSADRIYVTSYAALEGEL